MATRTASEDTVSDTHITANAHHPLENSKILLSDSSVMPVSKDAIESINHDGHLAFALRARGYNSQVPINRLHPELLGMVFEHLREPTKVIDPKESLGQSVFALYTPLIHAMAVCHRWYVVATDKASLWTDVDYSGGLDGPTCLLQRSGTAPIHLRMILPGTRDDMTLFPEIVHANASRLRQLDVCMTGLGTMRTVGLLLGNDMPLLRSLKLADEYDQSNTISRSSLGSFPSLRGMMLMDFFFLPAPDVGPITKLTHLYISMLSEISLASITTFLDATPALQVLELHECTGVTLSELPTGTTILAHLTHFTIRWMFTRVAEVLMPALALPRATVVCLWFDVDAAPTDALLPRPQYWRDATRVRAAEGPFRSLTTHLEDPTHPYQVAICLKYDEDERSPLWPLPVPTLAHFPSIAAAHLSVFRHWRTALAQCAVRFPALTTLIVEGRIPEPVAVADMVGALRDVLREGVLPSEHLRLKDVALVLPCTAPGLTNCLAFALRKRKKDGVPLERLGTWVVPVHESRAHHAPKTAMEGDVGDALAQYVMAGRIEHEKDMFWPRDEELWRQENEFWEVQRM